MHVIWIEYVVYNCVFDILQKSPQTVDDVAINLHKTVPEVLNAISTMEIENVVEKNQEHKYQIKLRWQADQPQYFAHGGRDDKQSAD